MRTSCSRPSSSSAPIRPPVGPTTSSSAVPPTDAVDHSAISLSPCSPTIVACTLLTPTPSRSASRWRSRDVSSTVPLPITRSGGSPRELLGDERDDVDRVRHQQHDGRRCDVEDRRQALGGSAPRWRRPARVGSGPGSCLAPAVTTTRSASRHTGDIAAARDVTAADELQAVAQVQHLGPGAGRVDVVQRDLVGDPADHAGVGDRGADAARRRRPPPCPTRPSGHGTDDAREDVAQAPSGSRRLSRAFFRFSRVIQATSGSSMPCSRWNAASPSAGSAAITTLQP